MESKQYLDKLQVTFLPYPTPGHMTPMIDTARLFAKHGVNVTIITTHANASIFQKTIDSDFTLGYSIKTQLIKFPSAQVGLPEGIENIKDGTSLEILGKISYGLMMLRDPIEVLFQDLQPDCIVSDMMYAWTVESAAKLNIPRIHYYSSSYFSNCACQSIMKYRPHDNLVSDKQKFTIPGFPHTIEMTPLEIPDWLRKKNAITAYFEPMFQSEEKSYGTLYNSFHELESDYVKLSRTTMGIKCWSVGPVSAWINKDGENEANREVKNIGKDGELLSWLNSKKNDSVLYVSFGSLTRLSHAQLVEIAHGLENSGHNFIWVVRKIDEDKNDFLHDLEVRMKESKKGYIIWNWAPQLLILDHPGTGGIMTHCGWNSILESLNAGLPMITWPMFAEQFYNEKLLVDVLKIGVSVGSKVNEFWATIGEEVVVKREEIVKAVEILMGNGNESKEMRMRAKKLGDASKRTIEEGGDSYNNLI